MQFWNHLMRVVLNFALYCWHSDINKVVNTKFQLLLFGKYIMFKLLMLFNTSWRGFLFKINVDFVQVSRINNSFIQLLHKCKSAAIWWLVSHLRCNTAWENKTFSNFDIFLVVQCGIIVVLLLQMEIWIYPSLRIKALLITWGECVGFHTNS